MNVVLHPVVASTYICCADHNFHHFTTINESKNLRMRKSKFSELQSLPNLWSLLYFQSAVTILWWLQMATYCICTVIHVELRFFSLAHTSYQMSDLYLSLTTKVKLYHFSFSTHSLISSFMFRNAHSNKNGTFDKKWSNWVNVHGFDNFGEFRKICQSKISLVDLMILTDFSQIP